MGKVLFVDDEKLILNSLKRGLKSKPFNCYYANSGMEALKILENTDIDVVFSDMKMPHMSGLELLKRIDKSHPDMVKIILSGYSQLPQLIATINNASIFKYVAKPYDLHKELIPLITEAIEYAEFKKEAKFQKESLALKNEAYKNMFKTITTKAETKEQGYDLIRIYNQVLIKILKDQIKDDSLHQLEHEKLLDQYKRFSDYYLTEIKKNEIYFEPRCIINEIEYTLKRDKYNIYMEIGVDETSKNLYEGRGMHIKPVIISLIEDFVEKDTVGQIKIISTEIGRDGGNIHMVYIVEGHKRVFSNYDPDMYNVKLYKSMLNLFGGDLEFKEVGEKIIIFVKVRLHLGMDDGEENELVNR